MPRFINIIFLPPRSVQEGKPVLVVWPNTGQCLAYWPSIGNDEVSQYEQTAVIGHDICLREKSTKNIYRVKSG